jgi:hypothetical protein
VREVAKQVVAYLTSRRIVPHDGALDFRARGEHEVG